MVKLTNHGALDFIASGILVLLIITTVDTKVMPIWNTIGVIPGHIKDEVVLVGNHRDGACWNTHKTSSAAEIAVS